MAHNKWAYQDFERGEITRSEEFYDGFSFYKVSDECKFCKIMLSIDEKDCREKSVGWSDRQIVGTCNICGWWILKREYANIIQGDWFRTIRSAQGVLKEFDVKGCENSIEELQAYLKDNYEKRFMLHPRKYELLVASIFRNEGHHVRATSYSKDGGIDLFVFDSENSNTFGVEVKRYKGKIEAEQIRSFAGALILNNLTQGIYVTTSKYTIGAKETANSFTTKNIPIELVDSSEFYDKLQLVNFTDEQQESFMPYGSFVHNKDSLPLIEERFLKSI